MPQVHETSWPGTRWRNHEVSLREGSPFIFLLGGTTSPVPEQSSRSIRTLFEDHRPNGGSGSVAQPTFRGHRCTPN